MPKIIIHAPQTAFDATARKTIAEELTDFALECERLPKSAFVKSSVWIYFNDYAQGSVFTGQDIAAIDLVSVQIFVINGGLDGPSKEKLIKGATAIFGRALKAADLVPVYIVIHELPEINWGIFGQQASLAALRASSPDAPALF